MNNMVYILPVKKDISISPSLGVYKKVQAQIKGFEMNGISVQLCECLILSKYYRALPFNSSSINWRQIYIDDTVDTVYIRFAFFDYQLLKFCKKLKKKFPKIKILIEMPSFPYDKEFSRKSIKAIRDLLYRNVIHKYVDRFVTYSADKEIYATETIRIMNGIDMNLITQKVSKDDILKGKKIEMICVANFAYWHGIDRLLNGLIDYYSSQKEREINLHLVGNLNAETDGLKKMLIGTKAQDHVFWYGVLNGEALDDIYDKCNLAVECLGIFRKDAHSSSSLKSREYLAKGLPFIYSGKIDLLPNDYPYCKNYQENNEAISIESIVSFFDLIYSQGTEIEVNNTIREFAEQHCAIEKRIYPVVEYILNE